MNQTTEKRSPFLRVGRWVAELVLVFVGVYAAFWLNNFQQHREDAQRRDQILASLVQSGGVQLLDTKTLMAVRGLESVIRWGLSALARYQKLSDELIVPNLDQDISFFYDPATKKLRKRFELYPEALDARVRFANELERTHTELLKRIQAERQRIH